MLLNKHVNYHGKEMEGVVLIVWELKMNWSDIYLIGGKSITVMHEVWPARVSSSHHVGFSFVNVSKFAGVCDKDPSDIDCWINQTVTLSIFIISQCFRWVFSLVFYTVFNTFMWGRNHNYDIKITIKRD